MPAPKGVDAYFSGNGYQVTVDRIPTDRLLGYYVYRSCYNADAVAVNSTILSPKESGFVDFSILKPGKIFTYYVIAYYESGGIRYSTMNSKKSSVVWGLHRCVWRWL